MLAAAAPPLNSAFASLRITPLEGRRLKNIALTGVWPQDVFLDFRLSTNKAEVYESDISRHAKCSPTFTSKLKLRIQDPYCTLLLRAFALTPLKPAVLIGECLIDVARVVKSTELDGWFSLRDPSFGSAAGEVYLELTYKMENSLGRKSSRMDASRPRPTQNHTPEAVQTAENMVQSHPQRQQPSMVDGSTVLAAPFEGHSKRSKSRGDAPEESFNHNSPISRPRSSPPPSPLPPTPTHQSRIKSTQHEQQPDAHLSKEVDQHTVSPLSTDSNFQSPQPTSRPSRHSPPINHQEPGNLHRNMSRNFAAHDAEEGHVTTRSRGISGRRESNPTSDPNAAKLSFAPSATAPSRTAITAPAHEMELRRRSEAASPFFQQNSIEHLVLRTRLLELLLVAEFRCLALQANYAVPALSPGQYEACPSKRYRLPPIFNALYGRIVRTCPVLPSGCIAAFDVFVRDSLPDLLSLFQNATKINFARLVEYCATILLHLKSEVWPAHKLSKKFDPRHLLQKNPLLCLHPPDGFRLNNEPPASSKPVDPYTFDPKRPYKHSVLEKQESDRILLRRLLFVESWRRFAIASARCLKSLAANDAFGVKAFEIISEAGTFEELPSKYREWAESLIAALARTIDLVLSDEHHRVQIARAWKGVPVPMLVAALRLINPSYFVSTVIRLFLWRPLGSWGHSLLQKLGLIVCAYEKTTTKLASTETALNNFVRTIGGSRRASSMRDTVKNYCKENNPRNGRDPKDWQRELIAVILKKGIITAEQMDCEQMREAVVSYAELNFRKAEKEAFVDMLASEAFTNVATEFFTCVPPILNELYRAGKFADVAGHLFGLLDDIFKALSKYDEDGAIIGSNNDDDDDATSEHVINSLTTVLRNRLLFDVYPFVHKLCVVSPRGILFKFVDWILKQTATPVQGQPGTKSCLDLMESVGDVVAETISSSDHLHEADVSKEVELIMEYRRVGVHRNFWKETKCIQGDLLRTLADTLSRELMQEEASR